MYMWIIEKKIPNWSSKRIIINKTKTKRTKPCEKMCFYLKFYKNESLIPFD